MRLRFTVALLATLALAMPLAAQEQRGSIQGVIKDSQGGALVGATVTAKMSSAQESRGERVSGPGVSVVTDASGEYRFASLLPGRYEITANLSGFAPASTRNVDLRLGAQLTINFTLNPGGMAETVQVVAESPLIAITQSARSTSIRDDEIEKMPKGRDFSSLVTQAAGANSEGKTGGISIDGSSGSENRWVVDGAEVGLDRVVDEVPALDVGDVARRIDHRQAELFIHVDLPASEQPDGEELLVVVPVPLALERQPEVAAEFLRKQLE